MELLIRSYSTLLDMKNTVMKKLLTLLAGIALLCVASTGISQSPASAERVSVEGVESVVNNFDNLSLSTCSKERVEWTSFATITHSHPSELTPLYAAYHCCADLGGLSHRWYFAAVNQAGGTWSYNWSPVYGDWCP